MDAIERPAAASDPAAATPTRELRGVVERITYQNPSNGYTVARLAPERGVAEARVAYGDDRLVTVVGTLADLTPGEAIVAQGWWRNDPKHGWQFSAIDYRTSLPATAQGMKKYLASGLVKGLGPVNAGRIVDLFGEATFEIIDNDPERLRAVPGIGPVRAGRIAAAWTEQRHIREVMTSLQSYGVSTSLAVRIYKKFGDESGKVLAREPYRLAREVWGIGFKTADRIAQAIGIAPDAPERLQAGLLHALGTAADEGHTLLPEPALRTTAVELLTVEPDGLATAVEALLDSVDLLAARPKDGDPDAPETAERLLALAPFARAESSLASRLSKLALAGPAARVGRTFRTIDWPKAFAWLTGRHAITLAPAQEAAVQMVLTEPVAILTGGPGTGKTHTLRAVLTLARAKGLQTCWPPRPAAPPSGWRRPPASRPPPCTACSSSARATRPAAGQPTRSKPTWWSSTRPVCSTPCWPTSWSKRLPRAPTSCWSATRTSYQASARATSWPTCCGPSASRSPA